MSRQDERDSAEKSIATNVPAKANELGNSKARTSRRLTKLISTLSLSRLARSLEINNAEYIIRLNCRHSSRVSSSQIELPGITTRSATRDELTR